MPTDVVDHCRAILNWTGSALVSISASLERTCGSLAFESVRALNPQLGHNFRVAPDPLKVGHHDMLGFGDLNFCEKVTDQESPVCVVRVCFEQKLLCSIFA